MNMDMNSFINQTVHFLQQNVRHSEISVVLSQDDEHFQPSQSLIDFSLAVVENMKNIDLSSIAALFPNGNDQKWILQWPGEHYKLLASIVQLHQPELIIEIGTFKGASCLSMKKYLPDNGKIVTFDVIPWYQIPETGLNTGHFDGRLEQRVLDLTIDHVAEAQTSLFENADLIFVDAAKDGVMEEVFINYFNRINFRKKPLVIFDDIRVMTMIKIWRNLQKPKLDLTSYGHWTGTGLVEW